MSCYAGAPDDSPRRPAFLLRKRFQPSGSSGAPWDAASSRYTKAPGFNQPPPSSAAHARPSQRSAYGGSRNTMSYGAAGLPRRNAKASCCATRPRSLPKVRSASAMALAAAGSGFDELHCSNAARQRFEPEGPAAGKQVQAALAGQLELQPVEQGLADPVRGRAQRAGLREMQLPPAPFATDDADFASPPGRGGRVSRGIRRRSACCASNTFIAAAPHAVVARHRRASVGFGETLK